MLLYFRVGVIAFVKLDGDAEIPAPDSSTVFLNPNGVLGAERYDCDSALRASDPDTVLPVAGDGGASRYLHLLAMRSCQIKKPTNDSDEILRDVVVDM